MGYAPSKITHPYRYVLARPLIEEEEKHLVATVPGVVILQNQDVRAPLNCAWLLEETLRHNHVEFVFSMIGPAPAKTRWADVVARVTEPNGPVRSWVTGGFLAEFQKLGVLFAIRAPAESAHLHHPTGAGKSLEGIVWAAYGQGNTVFVTKAAARRTIFNEYQRYTTLTPLIMLPKSERKAKDRDPVEILEAGEAPAVIIVAWESLADFLPAITGHYPFTSLVMDEIHKAQMHKRWAKVPGVNEHGEPQLQFRRLDNTATAIQRLSSNAQRRLGLTATPIPDRRRGLWAPLDLVHPRAWGRPWDWFHRYCDVTTTTFGSLDNKGVSNTEELERRMSFVCHAVDYTVTHRDLPPKRRQKVYLTKAQQSPPGAFAKEVQRAMKQAREGTGRRSMVEIRLAEAASRKKGWLVDLVKDSVGKNSKIVVFTGRHADVERLDEALKKALPKVQIWGVHGGHGVAVRDEVREAYMAHEGPCVLVGTHQAWGESVNLQDTDLAVMAQLPINAKELWQTEGRFARQGQKRAVLIVYPICESTIDEHIYSILLSKLPDVATLQHDTEFARAHADFLGGPEHDQSVIDTLFEKITAETDNSLETGT